MKFPGKLKRAELLREKTWPHRGLHLSDWLPVGLCADWGVSAAWFEAFNWTGWPRPVRSAIRGLVVTPQGARAFEVLGLRSPQGNLAVSVSSSASSSHLKGCECVNVCIVHVWCVVLQFWWIVCIQLINFTALWSPMVVLNFYLLINLSLFGPSNKSKYLWKVSMCFNAHFNNYRR